MEYPEFDEEEFNLQFDDENPPIEIPESVHSEEDNDFDLEWEPPR